jgi:GGDEF domain-containing protein
MSTHHMNPSSTQPGALTQPASLAFKDLDGLPKSFSQDWISFTMRRLEPWVAWSIGLYTAWIALFAYPDLPALWLFVVYAGLIGKWCEVRPPRVQSEMFARGAALVAGAYVLHTLTSAEIGGPGGIFFFWLSITTLYYAFMLKPGWALAIVAIAVVEYVVSNLQSSRSESLSVMMAHLGFLLVFPLAVAMKFGAVMRRPDEAIEQSRLDRFTGLYNKLGLLEHGDELLAACQRERKPVTLAMFDFEDLRELREVYGRKLGRKVLNRVVRKLLAVAGERGLAGRTGPTEFTLMLPGLSRDKALQAIAREFGNPPRIEFDFGGEEIVLMPTLVAESATLQDASLGDLYDELCLDLQQRRERASQPFAHSQPSRCHSVPPVRPAPAPVPRMSPMPQTMPVALGLH